MSQTRTRASLVALASGRTLAAKLADTINAADYGAAPGNSATANTAAISAALAAANGTSGTVVVNPGVPFTESSLTIPNGVVLIVHSNTGTISYIVSSASNGGIVIKTAGNTGIRFHSLDYGVSAEPILRIIDATGGDLAATEFKFAELTEIPDPVAPAVDKARLFVRDNGSGKTQLCVRFSSGAVQVISTQP